MNFTEAKIDFLKENSISLPIELLQMDNNLPAIKFDFVHHEILGAKAIVIHKLFSDEECKNIVNFMDSNQDKLHDANSNIRYRNNQRIIVHNDVVASIILQRLSVILSEINQSTILVDKSNFTSYFMNSTGMLGEWKLHSLNHVFRLCKYNTLGHFGPHADADYVVDPLKMRSLKTFMIYLNDDYSDGETSFAHDHGMYFDTERNICCSPPENIYARLKAVKGDCLIFDHKILHEGIQVTDGCKYIMRTDIIYEKVNDMMEEEEINSMSPEEHARKVLAVQLWHEAGVLEANNEIDKAIQLYSRARRLYPEIEFS